MFKFFNSLLKEGQVINLSLMKCGDKMTVGVHPQSSGANDDAQSLIIPLVFTGTPEELDENFFNQILVPVKEATGLLSNMEEFSKSLKKADSESKAAKEITSKVEKQLKEAGELEKAHKTQEALAVYKKVLETDKNNSKAKAKVSELKQTDMFAEEVSMVEETEIVKPKVDEIKSEENKPVIPPVIQNELPKQESTQQLPKDMFSELMASNVKAESTISDEAIPLPQSEGIPPIPENMNISADQWEKFQQFQQFQASMNGQGK